MEEKKSITVNLAVSFDQVWGLIQQMPDAEQVNLLNQLQGRLEKDGVIAIRQDRKAQYENRLTRQQIAKEPDLDIDYFKVEDLAFEDGEEVELTEEEFLESVKHL